MLKGPARGKEKRGRPIVGRDPEGDADHADRLVRLMGPKNNNNFPGCGEGDSVNPNKKFPGRELELRW